MLYRSIVHLAVRPRTLPDVHFGLPSPRSAGGVMPTWKVLLVVLFGFICLTLAFATIVVPMTDGGGEHPWLWTAGLLAATAASATLFALFLRNADRAMKL
jgi:hypothetical protein